MSKIVFVALAVVLAGCASKAGPFVTNISSDGRGGLVVEKCMVRLDRTISTVESSDCTNTNITLSHSDRNSYANQ
jgi:type IV secretion system protein VirB7